MAIYSFAQVQIWVLAKTTEFAHVIFPGITNAERTFILFICWQYLKPIC